MSNDIVVGVISFAVIFLSEGKYPFFKRDQNRGAHIRPNLLLAGGNALLGLIFAGMIWAVTVWAREHSVGIANNLHLPFVIETAVVFLLFDLWMYWWHRFLHENDTLWRLHRTHHVDLAMDCSTALRFHPLEILVSTFLKLIVLVMLGMSIGQLAFYRAVMYPVILFHHSNINFPLKWDRPLGRLLVMPAMHRVHHSKIYQETNSNYGTVFSFWDRLFGSFRQRPDLGNIVYGIGRNERGRSQQIRYLLSDPWRG